MVCRQWAIVIACLSLCVAKAVPSSEIACDYDLVSEWPWVDDRICQTRVTPPTGLLLGDEASVDERSWPVCENSISDADGDGWGWENGQSCQVRASAAYPACKSSASDTDADGWGWENGKSCLVTNQKSGAYPVCEFIISDPDGDGWGYESEQSCKISDLSKYPVCSTTLVDFDEDGWGYEEGFSCTHSEQKQVSDNTGADSSSATVLFEQGFDQSIPGQYTGKDLNEQWNTPLWHLGFDQGRAHIIEEKGRGNSLQITYPAGEFGAAGASAFLSDLEFAVDLPNTFEELYVSYDVKFAEGFEFVRGGKLPGLCGYDNTRRASTGCNTGGGFPDGTDGWSARGMWREGGEMENYVYHSSQESFYGDDEYWGMTAQPGQWHQIQHRVVLNTVGEANGLLEAWFDGRKVLSETDFVYRNTPDIGINLFYFSTFYGGNDPTWAPTEDQYIFFDNFRIATTPLPETLAKAAALNDGAPATAAAVSSGGGGSISLSLILLALLRRSRLRAAFSRGIALAGMARNCHADCSSSE